MFILNRITGHYLDRVWRRPLDSRSSGELGEIRAVSNTLAKELAPRARANSRHVSIQNRAAETARAANRIMRGREILKEVASS